MKRVKKILSIAIASVMMVSLVGCDKIIKRTKESIGKTVLAKVGDEEITKDELDKFMYYYINSYKQNYGDDYEENKEIKEQLKKDKKSALDSLVQQEILFAKEKDLKVKYTDKEINKTVESQIKSIKQYYSGDEFINYISQYGYKTEKSFKKYLKEQARLSKILDKLLEDVKASDKEIEEYYNKNIDSFKVNAGADVTHILFSDKTTGKQDAEAARQLVLQGKTFKEIAEMDEYKDKCTTEDLGHQDFENNTTLVTEFVEGFKNLPEGQVSEPVQTSYGWHLILTSNINTEAKTKTLEEAKDEVESAVLNQKKSDEFDKKIKKFKKEMNVKIYEDRL